MRTVLSNKKMMMMMKYIKSYRVFESEAMDLIEMFELGIIGITDVVQAAKGPEEIADLLVKLVETAIIRGDLPVSPEERLQEMGISDQEGADSYSSEIMDLYWERISPLQMKLLLKLLDNYRHLKAHDYGEYHDGITPWLDKRRYVIFWYDPNQEEVEISSTQLWNPLTDTLGMQERQIEPLLLNWLAQVYGIDVDTIYPDDLGEPIRY